jgi:dipeptidyl aminopeptidase/acylaminoacyl peptidase
VTWRPEGPVAIVQEYLLGGTIRIWAAAVAFGPNVIRGGGQNRQLVDVTAVSSWAVRRDGSAFVFAIASYDGAGNEARLALWDAATGATRWLTAEDGDRTRDATAAEWPVWSADDSEVFFHRVRYRQGSGNEDLGMWRIKPDGTGLALVMAPPANAPMGSVLHGVTPDGGGLVWGRVGMHVVNGQLDHMTTSVEILDLATGAQRSLGCCPASVASWRATRPRALLIGDTGQLSQSSLVLWDDVALSERTLLGPGGIGGADWDPQGERIVVASGSATTKRPLSIIDASGRTVRTLPATEGAGGPRWDSAGIVYDQWVYRPSADTNTLLASEIRAIDPNAGPPATLFTSDRAVHLAAIVRP